MSRGPKWPAGISFSDLQCFRAMSQVDGTPGAMAEVSVIVGRLGMPSELAKVLSIAGDEICRAPA